MNLNTIKRRLFVLKVVLKPNEFQTVPKSKNIIPKR